MPDTMRAIRRGRRDLNQRQTEGSSLNSVVTEMSPKTRGLLWCGSYSARLESPLRGEANRPV